MELKSEARRCQYCGAPAVSNAVHCGQCGKPLNAPQPQPPLANQLPKQSKLSSGELTAIILIGVVVVFCALFGIVVTFGNLLKTKQSVPIATAPTPTPSPSPQQSVTPIPPPQPIGSSEQRLAVASVIRHYLRDQDIPAYVVASGTKLTISYQAALIEYAPDTFLRQQGKPGMERIANAGFETLIIEAKDANGRTQSKELSLVGYKTR